MPSYGGESDSGFGGNEGQGFGTSYGSSSGWGQYNGGLNSPYNGIQDTPYNGPTGNVSGGLGGAPDVGTLGGTMNNDNGGWDSFYTNYLNGINGIQDMSNMGVNSNPFGYDFNAAGMGDPNSFNLSNLFAGQQGLPTQTPNDESNSWNHPAVKLVRGLFNLSPTGALANLGIDAARGKDMTGSLLSRVPTVGPALSAGYAAYNSPDPARTLATRGAGMLGSIVGGGVAGPLGAMAGGQLASYAANQPTSAPNTARTSEGAGNGGTNWGQLAGQLYAGYHDIKDSRQLASNAANTQGNLQQSMAGLSDMYSPTGAYAKQLQQELARRDAKAGRNSQYGPRSVELQAKLAQMQLQAAQGMSGLANASSSGMTAAQAANQNKQAAQGRLLASILGDKSVQGMASNAWGGLKDLYNDWNTPTQQASTEYEWA